MCLQQATAAVHVADSGHVFSGGQWEENAKTKKRKGARRKSIISPNTVSLQDP